MNRSKITVGIISLMALIVGCATAPTAPLAADGGKIKVAILSNRGDPKSMTERQYQYRVEVGQWMERDLLNQLKRTGYDASQIKSKSEFKAGNDSYLLVVSMKSYNPGSSAARMLVGYGAGAASLENHYEFYGSANKALLEWDEGAGTSQHWSRIPRKLNLLATRKITQRLLEAK